MDIGQKFVLAFVSDAPGSGTPDSSFTVVTAGIVSLPTGHIIACDPLVGKPPQPFIQTVMPGRYAVELALLREEGLGERVALAQIRFSDSVPVVWVPGLRKGDKTAGLDPGEAAGYRSASGTAAFMDHSARQHANFFQAEDIDALLADLTNNYRPHRYWMEYPIDQRLNVVMFSAGAGEGTYPSYFGIDQGGDVCSLVTDFHILA